jgi:hypothetical protein
VCAERCKHGLEGGVGKHSSAVRSAPTLLTIHQSHAIGLLAGLRDGWMTTHFDPVFTVKVRLEPSQTVANCAVAIFYAVRIVRRLKRERQRHVRTASCQSDLPPRFEQAIMYNSRGSLMLWSRKSVGVSAYIWRKLLGGGHGVPNASRIAF